MTTVKVDIRERGKGVEMSGRIEYGKHSTKYEKWVAEMLNDAMKDTMTFVLGAHDK